MKIWALLLSILGLAAQVTSVPRALSKELNLSEAVRQALVQSPDLKVLQSQVESLKSKASQALSLSEPTVGVQFNDMDRAFNSGNPGSTVYLFSQPLGFPGKALVNRSSLSEQAQGVYFQLKSKELEIANSVKISYYQLAQAEKNILLNHEQKDSFERILAIAKRRYEAGGITQVDFLNAQIALYTTSNDLADLESTKRSALTQLNISIGNDPETELEVKPLHVAIKPFIAFKDVQEKMMQNRFEIKTAQHQAAAAEKNFSFAKMSLLPDFQITLGQTQYNYQTASPVNPLTTTYTAGIQMTLPLWSLFNERHGIHAASQDRAAALANVDSVSRLSRIALDGALESLKTLQKKIETYEKHLLPLSEQSFNLALISYSSGKIDFQSLADTASARRGIKRDYYSLLVNYALGYSSLGQLVGEDLNCE